nr:unnamed protein product [Callosobruchus analis]
MAHAQLKEGNIDLLLVSEPNRKICSQTDWYTDLNLDVAAYVRNRTVGINSVEKKNGYLSISLGKIKIYCCYCSPNSSLDQFSEYMETLWDDVATAGQDVIVLGDLNAKAVDWGSPVTDKRGRILCEWLSAYNMVVLNDGLRPTFRRRESNSYIDVTIASQELAGNIRGWEVLETETLSDHMFIYFEVVTKKKEKNNLAEYRIPYVSRSKFREELCRRITSSKSISVKQYTEVMKAVLAESTIMRGTNIARVPYWWNTDIESARRACISSRRELARHRRKPTALVAEAQSLQNAYVVARKNLQRLIHAAKKKCWKELCDNLEDDIWGEGYRLVTKQLQNTGLMHRVSDNQKVQIVRELFPTRQEQRQREPPEKVVQLFSVEELNEAADKLKRGKAPAPDNVPPEAIKKVVEIAPLFILSLLNELLRKQLFPDVWKRAKVVLLHKGGKPPELPSSYRPICLLDTVGKLFETMIRMRLQDALEKCNGLSKYQFGFRAGSCTVDAVETVMGIVEKSKDKWCALITLDVRNAFNTASWKVIMEELRKKNIPKFLQNIISSYLENRSIKIAKEVLPMTTGVPQGSALGPLIWNIFYNGVLEINIPKVRSIGFADDLALVATSKDSDTLERVVNDALLRIDKWMEQHELNLAPEKTEAVILRGDRTKRDSVVFQIKGQQVVPGKSLVYLGIHIDNERCFGVHVKKVIEKAEKKIAILSRLMPNVGGPSSNKRAILNGVIQSVVLYGAPAWHRVASRKKYQKALDSLQRKSLLRVASAYRTVSTRALQVITGTPPLYLSVMERKEIYSSQGALEKKRQNARNKIIEKWQQLWSGTTEVAEWTRRLIPSVKEWVECSHRTTCYFLTQALSGHSPFRAYRRRGLPALYGGRHRGTHTFCMRQMAVLQARSRRGACRNHNS